jgi:hypothetical protein
MPLLRDSVNNAIATACIGGATHDDLAKVGLDDLDQRLKNLVAGNILVLRGGRYFIAFPVVTGETREKLTAEVDAVAREITPQVVPLLDQIRVAVPDRPDMVFHLLWSRVMDRFWWRAWQRAFHHGTPPTTEWRIYPSHPFMVGTNSYDYGVNGDSFSVTWNSETNCNTRLVLASQLELDRGGWGLPVASTHNEDLKQLGLFDADMKFEGFAYHHGDRLDKLFKRLSDKYADLVASAYNYEQLGKSFNVPPDELFVIIQHETAYAILENLNHAGKLELPAVLSNPAELRSCRSLVSVMLAKHPHA